MSATRLSGRPACAPSRMTCGQQRVVPGGVRGQQASGQRVTLLRRLSRRLCGYHDRQPHTTTIPGLMARRVTPISTHMARAYIAPPPPTISRPIFDALVGKEWRISERGTPDRQPHDAAAGERTEMAP